MYSENICPRLNPAALDSNPGSFSPESVALRKTISRSSLDSRVPNRNSIRRVVGGAMRT